MKPNIELLIRKHDPQLRITAALNKLFPNAKEIKVTYETGDIWRGEIDGKKTVPGTVEHFEKLVEEFT